ncbi:MAG: class F sortase [Cellulomonas sp.]|nr:class F sortase [Cellulomonas sp.]
MFVNRKLVGRRGILAAAAVALALVGVLLVVLGLRGHAGPPQPAPQRAAISAPLSAAAPTSDPTPSPAATSEPTAPTVDLGTILPASVPVTLDIPIIGVHSTMLVPLNVGADGVLAAPTDFASPGWYEGGPTPGQLGPAIIAGHVDGPTGPAIFYRLGQLTPGAQVTITRQDSSVATFTIDTVASYAKSEFPTDLVYGNTTNRAELRLITCGGAFDHKTGHYVDNIIAFGHLST